MKTVFCWLRQTAYLCALAACFLVTRNLLKPRLNVSYPCLMPVDSTDGLPLINPCRMACSPLSPLALLLAVIWVSYVCRVTVCTCQIKFTACNLLCSQGVAASWTFSSFSRMWCVLHMDVSGAEFLTKCETICWKMALFFFFYIFCYTSLLMHAHYSTQFTPEFKTRATFLRALLIFLLRSVFFFPAWLFTSSLKCHLHRTPVWTYSAFRVLRWPACAEENVTSHISRWV